ncbi:Protein of unknown function [Pyronema omphalodes CBS 100304]|uniref:Uncharacterized protein n=1 Tax=Pyronema omphalodes (strain CBS 100304) TaxID=1076935 RepID=U4KYW5_PYROM|nr:Protein of unknown function [Pyronema omphalodes CBS 100304]
MTQSPSVVIFRTRENLEAPDQSPILLAPHPLLLSQNLGMGSDVDPPCFKQYRYAKLHRLGVILLELARISWNDSLKRCGLENDLEGH